KNIVALRYIFKSPYSIKLTGFNWAKSYHRAPMSAR
ncbi:MAG: hypothetical protein ACI8W6_000978, partial [Porticoccaceae bacterium]